MMNISVMGNQLPPAISRSGKREDYKMSRYKRLRPTESPKDCSMRQCNLMAVTAALVLMAIPVAASTDNCVDCNVGNVQAEHARVICSFPVDIRASSLNFNLQYNQKKSGKADLAFSCFWSKVETIDKQVHCFGKQGYRLLEWKKQNVINTTVIEVPADDARSFRFSCHLPESPHVSICPCELQESGEAVNWEPLLLPLLVLLVIPVGVGIFCMCPVVKKKGGRKGSSGWEWLSDMCRKKQSGTKGIDNTIEDADQYLLSIPNSQTGNSGDNGHNGQIEGEEVKDKGDTNTAQGNLQREPLPARFPTRKDTPSTASITATHCHTHSKTLCSVITSSQDEIRRTQSLHSIAPQRVEGAKAHSVGYNAPQTDKNCAWIGRLELSGYEVVVTFSPDGTEKYSCRPAGASKKSDSEESEVEKAKAHSVGYNAPQTERIGRLEVEKAKAHSVGYNAPQTDKSCVRIGRLELSGHEVDVTFSPDGTEKYSCRPAGASKKTTSEESESSTMHTSGIELLTLKLNAFLGQLSSQQSAKTPPMTKTPPKMSDDEHLDSDTNNCIMNTSLSPDAIKKKPYFSIPAPTDQRPDQSEIKASSPDYADGADDDLPGRVIDIPGDGHCLLHAAAKCLEAEYHPECSLEDIKRRIWEEWRMHKETYHEFVTDVQDVEKDLDDYIERKHFNSDSGDLIVNLLSNAMETEITIYYCKSTELKDGADSKLSHPPGRQGVAAKYSINLLRVGDGNFAHYSAIIKDSTPNSTSHPSTPHNTPTTTTPPYH